MPTVVVCSSASFYRHAITIESKLRELGFDVVLPHNAYKMAEKDDFDTSHTKTWYENPEEYHKKSDYMRRHFDEIAKDSCDMILVLNDEKHGQPHYIGPNVLMEMGLAFFFKKPIYILNEIPKNSPFEEEIKGFMPTVLHGQLDAIAL